MILKYLQWTFKYPDDKNGEKDWKHLDVLNMCYGLTVTHKNISPQHRPHLSAKSGNESAQYHPMAVRSRESGIWM